MAGIPETDIEGNFENGYRLEFGKWILTGFPQADIDENSEN